MTETKINLKPCPFCGRDAILLHIYDSSMFTVGCTEDNLCPGYVGALAPWYFGKELARVEWNRWVGEDGDSE